MPGRWVALWQRNPWALFWEQSKQDPMPEAYQAVHRQWLYGSRSLHPPSPWPAALQTIPIAGADHVPEVEPPKSRSWPCPVLSSSWTYKFSWLQSPGEHHSLNDWGARSCPQKFDAGILACTSAYSAHRSSQLWSFPAHWARLLPAVQNWTSNHVQFLLDGWSVVEIPPENWTMV